MQRRHQKLNEEAPSPKVTPDLRVRMGTIAVNAIKSIGYQGAGTLEFLLDQNGEFYFMEMNTRLQVEHPVTEAITGLDLVELQLRVASGEPLGLRQEDIRFSGHAIEVRLCSEDAAHDFMPQWPDGVVADAGWASRRARAAGPEISPFYHSMIAKLISHGATRDEARRKLIHGLEQTAAFGVTTNQAFLAACLRHPEFAAGEATTSFHCATASICLPRARARVPMQRSRHCYSTLRILSLRHGGAGGRWQRRFGFLPALSLIIPSTISRSCVSATAVMRPASMGPSTGFEIDELSREAIRFRSDGLAESARFFREDDHLYILRQGTTISVRDLTMSAPAAVGATSSDGRIRAAMTGRVVAVLVKHGERVRAGQPVITLEAMKMEHVHCASVLGTISTVNVTEGEQVTTGKIVVEIEASGA